MQSAAENEVSVKELKMVAGTEALCHVPSKESGSGTLLAEGASVAAELPDQASGEEGKHANTPVDLLTLCKSFKDIPPSLFDEVKGPFACSLCTSSFFNRFNLDFHLRHNHRKERAQVGKHPTVRAQGGKSHKERAYRGEYSFKRSLLCSLCGNQTITSVPLTHHLTSKHSDAADKKLVCSNCDCQSDIAASMMENLNLHDNHAGKRHACPKCNFRSTNKDELVEHVRENHSQATKCPYCSYSTFHLKMLAGHVAIHNQLNQTRSSRRTAKTVSERMC